jgi:flagellar biosynthesis protein
VNAPADPGGARDAIALRYERPAPSEHGSVPRVVAKGHAWLAERIVALAREHGVPVREDRDLVAMLSACELGVEIAPQTYAAVAELLAWLYRCNQELAREDG